MGSQNKNRVSTLYQDDDHQVLAIRWQDEEALDVFVQINQYVIINKGYAYIIDPGSAYSFGLTYSEVIKLVPSENIRAVFASHQDPDVSSSIPYWLNACAQARLIIPKIWERFVTHYGLLDISRITSLEDKGGSETLPTGDQLEFLPAHFLHSPGNFSAYDKRSKILFSGDIGSALFPKGEITPVVLEFREHIKYMEGFHKRLMHSNAICKRWVESLAGREIHVVAPQHGAIIMQDNVEAFLKWFGTLQCGSDIIPDIFK